MKYQQVLSGEWQTPVRKGYRVMCCDCGLVHRVNFRIRNKQIQLQVFADKRATANARRKFNAKNE